MRHKQVLKLAFKVQLLTLVICCGITESFAGGWPTKPKTFVISPSFTYFYANQSWDKDGNLKDYAPGSHFESKSIYLYGEYGLSRRITLVTSIPYVFNSFIQPGLSINTNGFTDAELGARYYITNVEFKHYFAVQANGVIPLYKNTDVRNLGFQSYGADLRLIASGSTKLFALDGYYNVELGGRQYLNSTGPFQLRYTLSYGLTLSKHHQVSLAATGLRSTSINKDFSPYLVLNKDFEYHQGSFNYVFIASSKLAFSVGVNRFLAGKSTGKGTSAFFSSIIRL